MHQGERYNHETECKDMVQLRNTHTKEKIRSK